MSEWVFWRSLKQNGGEDKWQEGAQQNIHLHSRLYRREKLGDALQEHAALSMLSGATVCDGVRAFNQTVMETLALRVPWPTACRLSYFPFLVCCHCEFNIVFMKKRKNFLITMLLMLRGRCLSNPSKTAIKELVCWINTLMTAQV